MAAVLCPFPLLEPGGCTNTSQPPGAVGVMAGKAVKDVLLLPPAPAAFPGAVAVAAAVASSAVRDMAALILQLRQQVKDAKERAEKLAKEGKWVGAWLGWCLGGCYWVARTAAAWHCRAVWPFWKWPPALFLGR